MSAALVSCHETRVRDEAKKFNRFVFFSQGDRALLTRCEGLE
jgi:hypothetical protein